MDKVERNKLMDETRKMLRQPWSAAAEAMKLQKRFDHVFTTEMTNRFMANVTGKGLTYKQAKRRSKMGWRKSVNESIEGHTQRIVTLESKCRAGTNAEIVKCEECKCMLEKADSYVKRKVKWMKTPKDYYYWMPYMEECKSSDPDAKSEITETYYCQRCKPVRKPVKKKK